MFRNAFTLSSRVSGISRGRITATKRFGVRRFASAPESPKRDSNVTVALTFGFLILGAAGFYRISTGASTTVHGQRPPLVSDVASEADIAVESPVRTLSLKAANKVIRREATSFVFDSKDGTKGRVDLTRVASNNPVEDEWAVGVGKGVGGGDTLYVGVYDGHAGWATSAVLRKALIPFVSNALSNVSEPADGDAIDTAIKVAFTNLEDRIMANAKKALDGGLEFGFANGLAAIAPAMAGSCALLTIYDPKASVLRTAITGDSRAVFGSWSAETNSFAAEALSKDQTGFNQDEVARIDKEHPGEVKDVINTKSGRLLGLVITRAFGDHRWKWPFDELKSVQGNFYSFDTRPNYKTPPYLKTAPEVTTRTVRSNDFVILASDGLWDVISNEDAVECVSRWLAAKRAGMPEDGADGNNKLTFKVGEDGWPSYKATPDHFAIEDLDNAAVCLVKNAIGGKRRDLFCGALSSSTPVSRYIRDDITVQVVFFNDPHSASK